VILAEGDVEMMCERTPVSLSLLDRFAGPAAQLLGLPVLPVRAKGVTYFGSAAWHHDSDCDVASVGLLAYLEALDESNGALRPIPGSHHPEFGNSLGAFTSRRGPSMLPGYPVTTNPGDVIALDEHLYHASSLRLGGFRGTCWSWVSDDSSHRTAIWCRETQGRGSISNSASPAE
jgi:Phytanoyl-CoA dioxygenase (PhyH)